jgi:UDP-glucose 6-dehydrogenase
MENAFLATKVAFVNQFYDLAHAANVDYAELRELFLLDARVGPSHTEVFAERGFGGKCLPKDLKAIVAWARDRVDATLLSGVLGYNGRLRERKTLSRTREMTARAS